jgi:hypothetical protein
MDVEQRKSQIEELSSILNLADQLKLPFLQILKETELEELGLKASLNNIKTSAEFALKLLDSYLLSARLSSQDIELIEEPLSINSILYDCGHVLDQLAKQYGVLIEMNSNSKNFPILGNKTGLESALISLGSSLIESVGTIQGSDLKIYLVSHRTRYGVVAGIYAKNLPASIASLKLAQKIKGLSQQPFPSLIPSAGSGVLIANNIFKLMNLKLYPSRYSKLNGLSTILKISQQLQLI